MAKHPKMIFDKTEVTIVDETGKRARLLNLSYEDITSITLEPCRTTKLFKTIDDERLSFRVRRHEQPLTYLASKEYGDFFQQYKEQVIQFAKENRITFYNYVDNPRPEDGKK